MATEVFYRMQASLLEEEVEGFGTLADAIARWQSDPGYDGPDIDLLLQGMGATRTYHGELGGIEPELLGFPRRLVERVRAVGRSAGPWPTHFEEPEVFQDRLGIVWVAHEELVAAHRRVRATARHRFEGVAKYELDPESWLQDLEPWLAPVGRDEIEVWLFEVAEPQAGPRGRPWEPPSAEDDLGDELPEALHWVLLPWVLLGSMLLILGILVWRTP